MTRPAPRRAFSLVELLVVIAIIALVISIILPALGGVRTAARRAATQTVMKGFSDAVGQFTLDNDRVPGIYSAEEMGSIENRDVFRMSAMENAILELAGGVVTVGGPGGVTAGPNQVRFGPTNAALQANNQANRMVDVTRIGAAGEVTGVLRCYSPVLARLRMMRTGILLGPDAHTRGDVLHHDLEARDDVADSPGRGWLTSRSSASLVQLATP